MTDAELILTLIGRLGLTRGEARLLVALRNGVPVPYERIADHLGTMGGAYASTPRDLHGLLKRLRPKLPPGLSVRTIRGVGLHLTGLRTWLASPQSKPLPRKPGLAWQRESPCTR